MSIPFESILVPLDGSKAAARGLDVAVWLASRTHARVHVLTATPEERPVHETLRRLRVPADHARLVTLHQVPGDPRDAIVDVVGRLGIGLVVMAAHGTTAETHGRGLGALVGHVTEGLIERCGVPVLVLPRHYREALPWRHVLVPVSGEPAADDALALALRFAAALDLDVHVAHVSDGGDGAEDLAAHARYADAVHHEYPQQLEEFVRRALPRCAPDECRRVVDVALCRGDAATELLGLLDRKDVSLLVLGWHGRFATGHARVLKRLIEVTTRPVLLVREQRTQPFRLHVGEEIEP